MLVMINALKSIARSKGRNILIGIIVLVIAASSCVALAIKNAANEAEAAGVELMNITGSISVDRQKMMEAATADGADMSEIQEMMAQYQDLSLEELLGYAESDYVKDFYYSSSISLDAGEELEPYSTQSSGEETTNDFPVFGGQGQQGVIIGQFSQGDFTITGYSAEDAMTKFINGTSKITDGEMFDITSSDMSCLISYELALFNGLSVGDTITLVNPNEEDETYTFTITGIYTDSSASETTGNQMRFSTAQDPANLICISYGSLQAIIDNSASVATTSTDTNGNERTTAVSGQLSGTFVFSNVENYESFEAALPEMGLSEYYVLSSSDINNYESSLLPLQNLSNFATTLLIVVLAIGALILIVINVFNIRERKYEVGVLTAVGVKKGKVAMQFVTELLCITLVAIVIGTGIGAAVSVPISNDLLASQIEQMQTQSNNQEINFGRPGNGGSGPQFSTGGGRQPSGQMMDVFGGDQTDVDYLDKINATVDFSVMGQLIGIGILLTLVSSLAAVVFIMRYEPLKILANRA